MTSLFTTHEIVRAEVEARRERLTRDWLRHPRRPRRARPRHPGVHQPVRARRPA